MSVILEVEDATVSYPRGVGIQDVSFEVADRGFACLLGPSGSGKTTTLRALAGFERLTAGCVRLSGRAASGPGVMIPPEQRRIGMVFQDVSLFPHLTVAGNIAFGLRGQEIVSQRATVAELLDIIGLQGSGEHYPHELSGGEQQRVALARALAPRPKLMLLDEPFSSLDVDLRQRLGDEVRAILAERGVTTVLVTHDQHEAFALADWIGVMNRGRMIQWDTPYNLYHQPCDRFVADFIGQGVFVRGRLVAPDIVATELGPIKSHLTFDWPTGSEVDVLLRPDDILPDPGGALSGTVVKRAFKGSHTLYSLRLATGDLVLSMFPSHHDHQVGDRVEVRLAADHLVAFRASS